MTDTELLDAMLARAGSAYTSKDFGDPLEIYFVCSDALRQVAHKFIAKNPPPAPPAPPA